MQKRYFWAIGNTHNGSALFRFRQRAARDFWVKGDKINRVPLLGTDPEVRRIQRRIARGENIQFPTEV